MRENYFSNKKHIKDLPTFFLILMTSRGQIEETPVSVEDFLDQDDSIRGQNYVCMSFISPEDVIRSKEAYFIKEYMKNYTTRNKELMEGLQVLFPDKSDEIRSIKEQYDIYFDENAIIDDYATFKKDNELDVSELYSKENKYQTNIRGVKIRGTYESLEEAKIRAEVLKRKDNNKHNIYIGQVGCWCPWAANPNEIDSAEYTETQLNTLMKEYMKNKENKEQFYNERKQELVDRATEKQKAASATIVEEPEGVNELEAPEDDVKTVMEESDAWSMRKMTITEDNNV